MKRRRLGSTGFEIAPLALGGNVFGWTADEPTSFRVLDAFVDAGFNLIDTADSYSRWAPGHSGGESETVIGRWIGRRGRHDDVLIATKVGSDMPSIRYTRLGVRPPCRTSSSPSTPVLTRSSTLVATISSS